MQQHLIFIRTGNAYQDMPSNSSGGIGRHPGQTSTIKVNNRNPSVAEPGELSPGLSIVIPVYNAEATIALLVGQLVRELESLHIAFEIILVEDCSRDNSWSLLLSLARKDPRIRGYRLSRNFGQHSALLCGVRYARYDKIITMDDDLQHPVSEIRILLDKLEEGHDLVYGTPQAEQHGWLRNGASQFVKFALQRALGVENARNISAFRAFRTRLRDGFSDYRSPSVSLDVLLFWVTSRISAIAVDRAPRQAGKSNYTISQLLRHATNLLIGFSTLPLRFTSFIGFVLTFFGLIVLAWVLIRYFFYGSSIPGFPFLASIIAIFSGAQLFSMGVIGEYVARIYMRSMERPQYIVAASSLDAKKGLDDGGRPAPREL
jgi:undecaprenyl-phosphate 4-deoxy-4-formamido-L-arabinose transferase